MNTHTQISELLPLAVSGTLDEGQRRAVEAHLRDCAACQADLVFWTSVSRAVVEGAKAQAAPPGLADRALESLREGRARPSGVQARLRHGWQLLRSQVPIVHREIWPASALVVGLGFAAALVSAETIFLYALAPLVCAACLSLIFSPDNDPSLELAFSTPTSPRQILLARLVLVYGYNLALMLVTALGLAAALPGAPPQALFGTLVLSWLAPMTFLSAAALLLSLWAGAGNAISIAYAAWLVHLLAWPLRSPQSPVRFSPAILEILAAYQGFWGSTGLLLALSLLLFGLAVWMASWERYPQFRLS
jgi:hypothetical protein